MLTEFTQSNSIRSIPELITFLTEQGIDPQTAHLPTNDGALPAFPIRIPKHYAKLINWHDPHDPLRLMVLPNQTETDIKEYELPDPIGDHDREAVPGLIHRYPNRVLLLLTSYCLVHCRFCFRKDVVSKVRPVEFAAIREYLRQHTEVNEVIFSGGDPLTFPIGFLTNVAKQLGPLSHITTWRFHTRIPAVDPTAISVAWLDTLQLLATKYSIKPIIAIHINHVRELTPETLTFINHCLDRRMMLLSQTVLLKGVNNQADTLGNLFTALTTAGVKPYYLHHLDRAYGTHQFRVSLAEGLALFQSLRGSVSSFALPEYVLDLPGGYGKIPVAWLKQTAPNTYQATTFDGQQVAYTDYAV